MLSYRDYDDWKLNPPEDIAETKCKCSFCKEPLYYDDEYWELDGEIFCEECAEEWLSEHKHWVSSSMASEG